MHTLVALIFNSDMADECSATINDATLQHHTSMERARVVDFTQTPCRRRKDVARKHREVRESSERVRHRVRIECNLGYDWYSVALICTSIYDCDNNDDNDDTNDDYILVCIRL
jgi:hypothetical protein